MPSPYVNASGVQFVLDHLAHFPRPDREVTQAIRTWGASRNLALDPDEVEVVTLHYKPGPHDGYLAVITSRMTLTQAVLSNWQGESDNNLFGALFSAPWAGRFPEGPVTFVDNLPALSLLDNSAPYQVFNGLFRRSQPARYDSTTHLQLPAEDFQRFIWNLDFHSRYTALLDDYWKHLEGHRLSAKIAFITACNKQAAEGSLSDAGRRFAWQAAGLMPRRPTFRMRVLNIYGYIATDLVFMYDQKSTRALLYVPGNASPLHEFTDEMQMKTWVARQCRNPATREALRQHFALADMPDGLDFSGLETALAGLAEYPARHRLPSNRPGFTTDGRWAPADYVNYQRRTYCPRIRDDLFQALAERQRQRSYQDADWQIVADNEVIKARWRGYLTSAVNLLAPMAFVLPELAPLFALGGVAQFGLGLDQAINGKSAQEKAEGVGATTFGLLNAAPLIQEGLTRVPAIFRFKFDGFVVPSRINDKPGYPLSPITPPHFPAEDVAPYFHHHDPIAPLPQGDPATAGAVVRTPRFNGEPDMLAASIDGYGFDVAYDLETDAFIMDSDVNAVAPYHYIARPGSRNLVRVDVSSRPVTHEMRMASLRALGVDLRLPVQVPAVPTEAVLPIPKQILSIWVGDKVISESLMANVALNAQCLKDSQYALRFYLSNATPAAFQENLRLLAEHAPNVIVLPLEEQAFYAGFRQSRNFAQYQAAIDGNGGVASNFSSASDVLRYALLNHEGGLYMDVDDSLLAAGEPSLSVGEAPVEAAGLDQVTLATTPDGLLLFPPMSNEKMAMNCLYNTSLIGSHAGNPTLEAIAEEMHTRYLAEPDFYQHKPSLITDPERFYAYANTLSRLTGPALLTDVVDRRLPGLQVLRQVLNLCAMPRINTQLFVDVQACQAAVHELLPLNRIARVGGNHSWART